MGSTLAFAQDRLLAILRGEVKNVIAGLRRRATVSAVNEADAKVIATVCGYFENNASRMRYDVYLSAGYPIATGVIEGACRHVIKDRMEQGGMRWTREGAQAMLNLRAIHASDAAEEFGFWRQEEGAQRVHPHRQLARIIHDSRSKMVSCVVERLNHKRFLTTRRPDMNIHSADPFHFTFFANPIHVEYSEDPLTSDAGLLPTASAYSFPLKFQHFFEELRAETASKHFAPQAVFQRVLLQYAHREPTQPTQIVRHRTLPRAMIILPKSHIQHPVHRLDTPMAPHGFRKSLPTQIAGTHGIRHRIRDLPHFW